MIVSSRNEPYELICGRGAACGVPGGLGSLLVAEGSGHVGVAVVLLLLGRGQRHERGLAIKGREREAVASQVLSGAPREEPCGRDWWAEEQDRILMHEVMGVWG